MPDTMTFESEVHSFESTDNSYNAGSMIGVSIISIEMQMNYQIKA